MKKTLAAVAVLGAFAGSALAADVTLYGRIDTGFQYHSSDVGLTIAGEKFSAEDDTFSMESGSLTSSRVGIKGSEEISEGLTVGFVLEKGFKGDSGNAGSATKAFDREASVYVKTDYGTLYAGRINSIWSDGGSTNFWAGNYSALGTGNGVALGTGLMVGHSRADNRLTYISPEFAGMKLYAEYAFGGDGATENTSQNDRQAAVGLNYKLGAFGAGLVVTYNNEQSTNGLDAYDVEDAMTVNLGTSYDFGVAKVKLAAQYYKDADTVGAFADLGIEDFDELEGYAVTLGADIPVLGGTWTVGAGYSDGEDKAKGSNVEFKGYEVATYYQYPLSKRTKVYAGVGYENLEIKDNDAGIKAKLEYEDIKAMFGMAHYF